MCQKYSLLIKLLFCVSNFFTVKKCFLFQNNPSIIILLFLKAKWSTFAWGLIFVDENYLNNSSYCSRVWSCFVCSSRSFHTWSTLLTTITFNDYPLVYIIHLKVCYVGWKWGPCGGWWLLRLLWMGCVVQNCGPRYWNWATQITPG